MPTPPASWLKRRAAAAKRLGVTEPEPEPKKRGPGRPRKQAAKQSAKPESSQ